MAMVIAVRQVMVSRLKISKLIKIVKTGEQATMGATVSNFPDFKAVLREKIEMPFNSPAMANQP